MRKLALIVPHDYKNTTKHYAPVIMLDDETQEKKTVRTEFEKTRYGRIKVIRNHAILNPTVIDIATEVTLSEDNEVTYG